MPQVGHMAPDVVLHSAVTRVPFAGRDLLAGAVGAGVGGVGVRRGLGLVLAAGDGEDGERERHDGGIHDVSNPIVIERERDAQVAMLHGLIAHMTDGVEAERPTRRRPARSAQNEARPFR